MSTAPCGAADAATVPIASRQLKSILEDAVPTQNVDRHSNALAVAIAVVSLLVQFGSWVWWGGRLDQKVERHEQYINQQEAINKSAAVDIEVSKTQLKQIKEVVDRIDGKLSGMPK